MQRELNIDFYMKKSQRVYTKQVRSKHEHTHTHAKNAHVPVRFMEGVV